MCGQNDAPPYDFCTICDSISHATANCPVGPEMACGSQYAGPRVTNGWPECSLPQGHDGPHEDEDLGFDWSDDFSVNDTYPYDLSEAQR